MIRLGKVFVNEEYLAAVAPWPVDDPTPAGIGIYLSTGAFNIATITMEEAELALVQAGLLDPLPSPAEEAFTIDELEELARRYRNGYRYAAKDKDGKAYAYGKYPTKGEASWINDDKFSMVRRLTDGAYDALSFDDGFPLAIEDILQEVPI